MGATHSYREVEREVATERQDVTSRQAAAHEIALLARVGKLVVEMSRVVHGPDVASFFRTEMIAYLGRDFPKGVTAVLVIPSPGRPGAVQLNAPRFVHVPFCSKIGSERGPAQQVGT